jgi:parallel beta-helix repeat protein
MKGIQKNTTRYFVLFFVLICFLPLLLSCDGVTPSGPTISSFTATSTSITEGESVTLSWVTNATSVSINQGVGTVTAPSGSTTVTPASTTTYTLTATNSTGSSTNSITITISTDDPTPTTLPVIVSFNATSTSITEGGSVTLSWETTGATNVYLSHDSLSSAGSQSVDLSGSAAVAPDEVTIYTLTAINSDGSDEEDITIMVNPDLPVYNLTKHNYYSTIQAAIDASDSGDKIKVSPGVYNENLLFSNRNITLSSTNPSNSAIVEATIIDGRDIDSVVRFTNADASTLAGFTIKNGRAESAGGIRVYHSFPTIEDNIIKDNDGCGIWVFISSPVITGNTITGNKSTRSGGGIFLRESSSFISSNNINDNETTGSGGGIYVLYGSPTIINNNIKSNEAGIYGGGIYVQDSTLTITGNHIILNIAGDNGGGIYVYERDYPINHPTIKGNKICSNSSKQVEPDSYPDNDIDTVCP